MARKTVFTKTAYLLVAVSFLFTQPGFAQVPAALTATPGSIPADTFRPVRLRYLSYNPAGNTFVVSLDKGSGGDPDAANAANTLLNYFFVGLALSNDSFWVNLRPNASQNVLDGNLAATDMGRIMLETDLQLKKDTARFTSPATIEGKTYWESLYRKAEELFGDTNVEIPTLTRPWIVPDKIVIGEARGSAYIYKATLKIMLEQDYLTGAPEYNFKDARLKQLNEYSCGLIRKLIIPRLAKEINTGARYAGLRQVYYSLILAQWFKARFSGGDSPCSKLIDTKNIAQFRSKEPWSTDTYFKQYRASFEHGEYDLSETTASSNGQIIRRYVSGGELLRVEIPRVGADATNPETGGNTVIIPSGGYNKEYLATFRITGSPEATFIARQKDGGSLQNTAALPSADTQESISTAIRENRDAWDATLATFDRRLRNSRGKTTGERLEIIKELNTAAEKEIERLRELDPAVNYSALSGQNKAWDDGLSPDETEDPRIRQNNTKGLFQGTSMGVLIATALIRGTLGGISGLELKRTSLEKGMYAEAQFFTSAGLYIKKDPKRPAFDEYGMPLESGVTDPLAESIVQAGSFASIRTRPSRAVSTYYAFRLAWEKAKANGQLFVSENFQFPSIDLFLLRAIVKVPSLSEAEYGKSSYPEILTLLPVALSEAKVMIGNDIPVPPWDMRMSGRLEQDDPENLVFFYARKDYRTGKYFMTDQGMEELEKSHTLLKEQLDKLSFAIGNRAADQKNWVSLKDVFTKIAGKIPATLSMSEAELEMKMPYFPLDEALPQFSRNRAIKPRKGFATVEIVGGTEGLTDVESGGEIVKDRGEDYKTLMLRKDTQGQLHMLYGHSDSAAAYDLEADFALGSDIQTAVTTFKRFATKRNLEKLYFDVRGKFAAKLASDMERFRAQAEKEAGNASPVMAGRDGGGLPGQKASALGGIDFRTLPIATRAIGNLNTNFPPVTPDLAGMDLGREWKRIRKLVDAALIPSTERIKDYVYASCLQDKPDTDKDKVTSCIADILRMEEERDSATEQLLQDLLIALQMNNRELKAMLIVNSPRAGE